MQNRNNKQVLFVGSFLSAHRGSKGPTEHISAHLNELGYKTTLASKQHNKYLRLLDTILKLLFFRGEIVCIDVYSGNAFRITEIASAIAKIKGHKIILNLHGGRLYEFLINNPTRVKRVYDSANKVVSPSLFLINVFSEKNLNVEYHPNPIYLDNFKYNRDQIKPNSILWIRAFDKIYNPDIPPKLLARIKQIYPDATLTMIGPNRGELEQVKTIVTQSGLSDSVFFTGPVQNHLLHQYYQTHAVFINTTSYESFGVSLMEAAACGIPIVSNSVGEIALIWQDRVNAMLVKNNDINGYVNKITELLSSPELSHSITNQAVQNTLKFDQTYIIKNWITLLNNI